MKKEEPKQELPKTQIDWSGFPKSTQKQVGFNELNIIDDWLDKNGSPEIAKQVEEEAKELCGKTLEELPAELESVLAKITHLNELGLSQWYEVVYYVDGKWCSYSGSNTFQDGEKVVEWKYCKNLI
jgi:hypothetical protein